MARTAYISGHLDLTPDEFSDHYAERIMEAFQAGDKFVVGDALGADTMAQEFLLGLGADLVVYHMFDAPRYKFALLFPTIGGFKSDTERDEAMTAASNYDIAWVREGREKSGTAKNINRRTACLQREAFEELYQKYWEYVFKYEVHHPEDFKPDSFIYSKEDFRQRLEEDGMMIKVTEGY